jgi:hypothetical protein
MSEAKRTKNSIGTYFTFCRIIDKTIAQRSKLHLVSINAMNRTKAEHYFQQSLH